MDGLPRTNSDLEDVFGSNRYHERRTTGCKAVSPALVLRGSVRVVAATATRLRSRCAAEMSRAISALEVDAATVGEAAASLSLCAALPARLADLFGAA